MVQSQTRTPKGMKSPSGLSMSATRKPNPSGRFTGAIPSRPPNPSRSAWPKTAALNSSRTRCPPNHRNSMEIDTQEPSGPFGPVIYAYTRSQAVADGEQVEVSKIAAEAGIRFPVFLTRGVYDAYVTVPPGVTGQDEAGRLWDILWLLTRLFHTPTGKGPKRWARFFLRSSGLSILGNCNSSPAGGAFPASKPALLGGF